MASILEVRENELFGRYNDTEVIKMMGLISPAVHKHKERLAAVCDKLYEETTSIIEGGQIKEAKEKIVNLKERTTTYKVTNVEEIPKGNAMSFSNQMLNPEMIPTKIKTEGPTLELRRAS